MSRQMANLNLLINAVYITNNSSTLWKGLCGRI